MFSKEMWRDIDRTMSPIERKIVPIVTVLMCAQHAFTEHIAIEGSVSPNSLTGQLIYNGGDFGPGYLISATAEQISKVFIPQMPTIIRKGLSALAGISAVVLNETGHWPFINGGSPELPDIPAGLIGAACYLGISLWASRTNQAIQAEYLISSESLVLQVEPNP